MFKLTINTNGLHSVYECKEKVDADALKEQKELHPSLVVAQLHQSHCGGRQMRLPHFTSPLG